MTSVMEGAQTPPQQAATPAPPVNTTQRVSALMRQGHGWLPLQTLYALADSGLSDDEIERHAKDGPALAQRSLDYVSEARVASARASHDLANSSSPASRAIADAGLRSVLVRHPAGEFRRRLVSQGRVRPRLVVVPSPLGAQDLRLQFGGKFFPV